jgi:hypothetical protein
MRSKWLVWDSSRAVAAELNDIESGQRQLSMMLVTVVVGRPSVAAQPVVKACFGVRERWYIRLPLGLEKRHPG